MSEPPDNIEIDIRPDPTNPTIEVTESDPVITNHYNTEEILEGGTSTFSMTYTAKHRVMIQWSWSKLPSTPHHTLQHKKEGPKRGITSITFKNAQEKDEGTYYLSIQDKIKTNRTALATFTIEIAASQPMPYHPQSECCTVM